MSKDFGTEDKGQSGVKYVPAPKYGSYVVNVDDTDDSANVSQVTTDNVASKDKLVANSDVSPSSDDKSTADAEVESEDKAVLESRVPKFMRDSVLAKDLLDQLHSALEREDFGLGKKFSDKVRKANKRNGGRGYLFFVPDSSGKIDSLINIMGSFGIGIMFVVGMAGSFGEQVLGLFPGDFSVAFILFTAILMIITPTFFRYYLPQWIMRRFLSRAKKGDTQFVTNYNEQRYTFPYVINTLIFIASTALSFLLATAVPQLFDQFWDMNKINSWNSIIGIFFVCMTFFIFNGFRVSFNGTFHVVSEEDLQMKIGINGGNTGDKEIK